MSGATVASESPRHVSEPAPRVDTRRVIADLRALDRLTGGPDGARRVCWGEEWRVARDFVCELLVEIGLEPERDEAGNLWAYMNGEATPALALGSHVDSVPAGGWLDGALGVMAAVGVLRAWAGVDRRPPRTLALVDWADEEGARFGRSLFGSSAVAGTLDPAELADLRDAGGERIGSVLAANGVELARAPEAAARRQLLGAYLELHIEQGPVLERNRVDLGVVTAVTGMLGFRARFTGEANHAGTTPMELRRDALAGAARAVLALREEAYERRDMTANVGVISTEPGGFNVVPGASELTIDVRSPTAEGFARLEPFVRETLERIAAEEELGLELRETHRKNPVALDPALQDALEAAAGEEGATTLRMPSGAGHDAMVLAHHVPAAMLFVPSRGGLSHTPDEFTSPEQCELGARVIARAVRQLVA
jgi:allantoate deiminase